MLRVFCYDECMKPLIAITIVFMALTGTAHAQSSNGLVIQEVLTGGAANAKQEFIELYNDSDTVIDVSSNRWAVQVASSTAKDWSAPTRTIYLDGFIYPGSHYLIGSTFSSQSGSEAFPSGADAYFSSILSATTGHIRIIRSSDGAALTTYNAVSVHQFEWGATDKLFTQGDDSFVTPKSIEPGSSMERRTDDTGTISYGLSNMPTPQTDIASQPTPEEPPVVDDEDETVTEPLPDANSTAMPAITELLPNPKTPQTDASDEYIEIHNPSAEPINLKGYTIQSMATTPKKYTFATDTMLTPGAYIAFNIKQTKIALSNTKGQISLLNPEGEIVSQTAVYTNAPDGMAWAFTDSAWAWTASATPGAINMLTAAAPPPSTVAKQKTAKPAAAVTKKQASKSKTTKSKASSATKKAKSKTKKTTVTQLTAAQAPRPPSAIHSSILVAVLIITLLYGAYEYRHDLAARFARLSRNRSNRRIARQKP